MSNLRMMFVLMLSLTAAGQSKPVAKKVPLYKVVMICPKGQKLYVQQQDGFKVIGEGGLIQMYYKWYSWDGERPLFGGDDTAKCFKNPPKNEDNR